SLIEHLGASEFGRLRVGIGDPGPRPAEAYVLERFTARERPRIDEAVARAAAAVGLWLRAGVERAMTGINRRDLDDEGRGA
ncbi:MAG: aminoacyl-tRNA hydrolase, partial [Planctomycetota bacterium]